jgi:hypothetical protein
MHSNESEKSSSQKSVENDHGKIVLKHFISIIMLHNYFINPRFSIMITICSLFDIDNATNNNISIHFILQIIMTAKSQIFLTKNQQKIMKVQQ